MASLNVTSASSSQIYLQRRNKKIKSAACATVLTILIAKCAKQTTRLPVYRAKMDFTLTKFQISALSAPNGFRRTVSVAVLTLALSATPGFTSQVQKHVKNVTWNP
jgi:hypothetical protein